MATKKPLKSRAHRSRSIAAGADDWFRFFGRDFKGFSIGEARNLEPGASVADYRLSTVRAVLKTFVSSGMSIEEVFELFGQVAVDWPMQGKPWDDKLDERRRALIDKELRGTSTTAEHIELMRLTNKMRNEVGSRKNLSTEGARALHRRLLESDSQGKGK